MVRLGYGGACFWAVFCLLSRIGDCSTDQSTSNADYGDCEEETSSIADGICDASVNTAACGFDGGDCCECTCFVEGVACNTTEAEFSCEDPEAPTDCVLTNSPTSTATSSLECAGYVPHIQDGYCDLANNNAACGFDGGDCCACTCGDDLAHPCGVEGVGFDCQDPDVPSNCSLSLPGCGGYIDSIQDSVCDSTLNNEECGYDGGDCCECTCRQYGYYDFCGYYGYDCIDPSVPLECELYTDSPTPSPTVAGYPACEGIGFYIEDGYCDDSNNNLECGWDGGDCCRCTCIQVYSYSCSLFNCLDPSAATDCPTPSPLSNLPSSDSYYPTYSSPTTSSSDVYVSPEYYTDDTIPTVTPSEGSDDVCQEPAWLISDGLCDVETNTAVCGWDGGDCCECTCVDGNSSCGEAGYNCLDPAGPGECAQPTAAPVSGVPSLEDTPTTGTSLKKVEVGGVVTIATFGFVSVAVFIIGALVCIRRKCQAREQ